MRISASLASRLDFVCKLTGQKKFALCVNYMSTSTVCNKKVIMPQWCHNTSGKETLISN